MLLRLPRIVDGVVCSQASSTPTLAEGNAGTRAWQILLGVNLDVCRVCSIWACCATVVGAARSLACTLQRWQGLGSPVV